MAAHQPEPRELHVYTAEDVERMAAAGTITQAPSPAIPPQPGHSALDYQPPANHRRALKITRLTLALIYLALPVIAYVLLPVMPHHPTTPTLITLFLAFFVGPFLIGALWVVFFAQIYLLSLFDRKRMPIRWNIPLAICGGPLLAALLLYLAGFIIRLFQV